MTGGVALAEKVEELPKAEEPWPLPEGWIWTPLKRLSSFIGRGRGPTYVESGGVPVVNQKCIRWHRLETQHLKQTARETFERLTPELRVKAGDLLWNSTGTGTIGRALIYDGSIPELTFDSHVTLVRPASILPAYLGYLVETTRVQRLVTDGHVGSTNQQELPRSFVETLLVPLAPLAEQRRIIARVDALFADISEGEAALEVARKGLDTFRRALLKAAVTGELTKDWRAATQVTETGNDLLARIANDRENNHSPRGRARRAAEASLLDTSTLPRLPDGWAWATIRELAAVIGGLTKSPLREKMSGRAPYLRVANVQMGGLDLSHMKEIGVTDDDRQRGSLEAGDLLVVEGNGSIDQIGRCAIWKGEIVGCVHQNHIIKVRFADRGLPDWCFTWLLSPHGREQIEQVAASTSGLHTLSISKVEALPVPLPPPAEAAEILRRVSDALCANADTLSVLDAEAADAARLKQSILKAAFEGRLTPQALGDEPASALLAPLAEKPAVTTVRRGRPGKSDA